MGTWHQAFWQSSVESGVPRRERRSGEYEWYLPDLLMGLPLAVDAETDRLVTQAERAVRRVGGSAPDLAAVSRFLLRSEAIASSQIEGIAPSPRQVALAELGQEEQVRGIGEQARLVANNMTVVRSATTGLVTSDRITTEDLVEVHRALLPDQPRHHGLRVMQNWIGRSPWNPLDAEFVPPAPEVVPRLVEDLLDYASGASHSPMVQAALVHTQFETIHPFTDGNGRLGRALIHTVLSRRGLTEDAVLPISLVFATLQKEYVKGLTAFRTADTAQTDAGALEWVRTFCRAAVTAAEQAQEISAELVEIREGWELKLKEHRASNGSRPAVRSDSATAMILTALPGTPVLTAQTVRRIHGVSAQAAGKALEELHGAGILTLRSLGTGRRAYLSTDVLNTVTWAERQLASTRFDTRLSPPGPQAPARPPEG